MKILVLKFILLSILLVSCKTAEVDNSSQSASHTPNIADVHAMIDSMMNSDTTLVNNKLVGDMLKMAVDNPENFLSNLQKAAANSLYVYPNPTSGAVTVEFAHDFPFEIESDMKSLSLDLYYMDTKINTLEFSNLKDRKAIISADYLQKEGTYTIFLTGYNDIYTSFVVNK
jgi:fructose-specific component phosphotransferase system IIB-like protein